MRHARRPGPWHSCWRSPARPPRRRRSGGSWSSARARAISTSRSPPRWSRSTTWAASSGQWETVLPHRLHRHHQEAAEVRRQEPRTTSTPSPSSPTATSTWTSRRRPTCCRSSATTARASSASTAPPSRSPRWPEYGEMLGGYFDGHPWGDVRRPPGRRGPRLPRHGPPPPRASRSRTRSTRSRTSRATRSACCCGSTPARSTSPAKGVHRKDGDFAVIWARDYGKGRVALQRPGPLRRGLGPARDPDDVAGDGPMVDGHRPRGCCPPACAG